MATEIERHDVWEAMLEADYQKRYWHAKAASFVRVDRRLQILLAIFSSAAVLSTLDALEMQNIWTYLSGITAIIATALPFLNYTRYSVSMTDISSKWHRLEIEYSSIWRTIDKDGFDENRFKELKSQEIEIGKLTTDLPRDDKKLQEECYRQVLISKGVKNDLDAN